MTGRLAQRLTFAAALAALAAAGCATPSVPVPPPRAESISFEVDAEAGTARFSYGPSPDFAGALVYVLDRDKGVGVITTAEDDGSVAPTDPFPADPGDDIVVTFQRDDQLSAICVQLADGPSSPARECEL